MATIGDIIMSLKPMNSLNFDTPSTPCSRRSNSTVSFINDLSHTDIANDKFWQYNSPETTSSYESDSESEFSTWLDLRQLGESPEQILPSPVNSLLEWCPTSCISSSLASDKESEDLPPLYTLYHSSATDTSVSHDLSDAVATNLSTSLSATACSHVSVARSAIRRLSTADHLLDLERKDLEIAAIHHKGQAIRIIRKLHQRQLRTKDKNADELLASMISLATLDRCIGSDRTADLHHMAVRRILMSIDGPVNIRSTLLSRITVHLECIHGSTLQSYVWGRHDMAKMLEDLNAFFARLYNMSYTEQRNSSASKTIVKKGDKSTPVGQQTLGIKMQSLHDFGPQRGSILRSILDQQAEDSHAPTIQDRLNLICQLATTMTISTVILDHILDRKILQSYIDNYHTLIASSHVPDQPLTNALWLLQIHDQSEAHSRRTWQVAGWIWLLKHVNYSAQLTVKDSIMRFLDGKMVKKAFRLNSFHFSYAS